MGAWAGSAQGVLGDARASGDRERRGVADGGAGMPEVLAAAELEGREGAMMMMMFITQGSEGRGSTSKKSKATKSKGGCLERG